MLCVWHKNDAYCAEMQLASVSSILVQAAVTGLKWFCCAGGWNRFCDVKYLFVVY